MDPCFEGRPRISRHKGAFKPWHGKWGGGEEVELHKLHEHSSFLQLTRTRSLKKSMKQIFQLTCI